MTKKCENNVKTKVLDYPMIDPASCDFGLMLNSAVRYAIGRRIYLPGTIIGFVMPLLPYITH